jgi:cytochrome c oxidase subunit 2
MITVLDPQGPQAEKIYELWNLFFYLGAGVYILVLVFAFYPLIFRKAPVGPNSEKRITVVIAAAAAMTALILCLLLVESFLTGRSFNRLAVEKALKVSITGHQWWWEIRYEDETASNTFTTANELHIPINTPVEIKLKSNDVIHSLWIPSLHGKTDLIPGYENITWIQSDGTGRYRGFCAEFCGTQHAHMDFDVVSESQEDFRRWIDNQRRAAVEPSKPDIIKGKDFFLTSQCAFCHEISGTIAGSIAGPSLTHLKSRKDIAAGSLQNTPENLKAWIADPQKFKPGSKMPGSNIPEADLNSLVSYMETLK